MVHSGSASPMKTTPSASPHLTVPATAPPLQAAPPLVPPPGDTTVQDLTQTPVKRLTTDLTSNSDLTRPSTDPEPPAVTAAKALTTNSSPASAWFSTQTPTAAQSPVNGRTSGRKRKPKACDCCGPNSTGHDVRTSGRGRGRGRGRGTGRDLGNTPKRKVDGQLTRIKLDLTKEKVEEAKDEDDRHEKAQTTVVVADSRSQTPVALPVTVPLRDGPIRTYAAPAKVDAQKKEDMLIEGSGGKGGGDSKGVEMTVLGVTGRGAPVVRGRGRGIVGATSASNMAVDGGVKRGGLGGVVISSKTDAPSPLVFVQRQLQNKDAAMDQGPSLTTVKVKSPVKSPFGNGDTVNLSDTEPEEEPKEGSVSEMANGLLSVSRQSVPAPRSKDSEMQVDKTPDRTDSVSVPVTLSNGNVTSPTAADSDSSLMEVDISHPASVAPPFQGAITVCSTQHGWALRDHRLYCQPETWERTGMEEVWDKEQPETNGRETDGEKQNKESLEQLTEMIHGKMCSQFVEMK